MHNYREDCSLFLFSRNLDMMGVDYRTLVRGGGVVYIQMDKDCRGSERLSVPTVFMFMRGEFVEVFNV